MRRRASSNDWPFPFPAPGRPKRRSLPSRTESRWPFAGMETIDDHPVPPRFVRAAIPADEFKQRVGAFADDVGLISVDDPAIAHELDEIRWVYPHAKTLVCLIARENRSS